MTLYEAFIDELEKLAVKGIPVGRILRKASPGLRKSFSGTLKEDRKLLGRKAGRKSLERMRGTAAKVIGPKYMGPSAPLPSKKKHRFA